MLTHRTCCQQEWRETYDKLLISQFHSLILDCKDSINSREHKIIDDLFCIVFDLQYLCITKNKDMISKNKIKYIRSLELKKNRNKEGKFVAEGHKVVDDLLVFQPADLIVATSEWLHGKSIDPSTELMASHSAIHLSTPINYISLSMACKTQATSVRSSVSQTGLASNISIAVKTLPTYIIRRWCKRRWEASPE